MKLYAYLLEGRDWAVKDSYVKLKVGKFKSKTRVLKDTKNPVWNEEFVFGVHDLQEELVVSVYKYNDHEQGFFIVNSGNLVGRVKIPIWSVVEEENQHLPPTWFTVHRSKNAKSIDRDCGKVDFFSLWHSFLLEISLAFFSNSPFSYVLRIYCAHQLFSCGF